MPILMYHRFGNSRQVAALAHHGYQAVTLGRVWQACGGEATLPRHPVVLSFDGGYPSQYRTFGRHPEQEATAGQRGDRLRFFERGSQRVPGARLA